MNYSLNEVEATAKKAARGAGYSWGMAEEAGKATRWLCSVGISGPMVLAAILEKFDGARPDDHAPVSLKGEWQASDGDLCPLVAGAALSDSARIWSQDGVTLKNVYTPVMLLPFAGLAAHWLQTPVTLSWNGGTAIVDSADSCFDILDHASLLFTAKQVEIHADGEINNPRHHASRAMPTEADWSTLNKFAMRIYAPATEESRLSGAGAGLSDND